MCHTHEWVISHILTRLIWVVLLMWVMLKYQSDWSLWNINQSCHLTSLLCDFTQMSYTHTHSTSVYVCVTFCVHMNESCHAHEWRVVSHIWCMSKYQWVVSPDCFILRLSHCNTLQHTATHCHTLPHTATHCQTLQHTATHCNTRVMSLDNFILRLHTDVIRA